MNSADLAVEPVPGRRPCMQVRYEMPPSLQVQVRGRMIGASRISGTAVQAQSVHKAMHSGIASPSALQNAAVERL